MRTARCLLVAVLVVAPSWLRAQGVDAAIVRQFTEGRHLAAIEETRRVIRQIGGTNARLQSFLVLAYVELDSVVAAKREMVIYRRVAPSAAANTAAHRRLVELERSLDQRIPQIERSHTQTVNARRLQEARAVVEPQQRMLAARRATASTAAKEFAEREHQLTLSQGSAEQVAALIQRDPAGSNAAAARARLEEIRWRAADSIRTLPVVNTFLTDFPNGRSAPQATRLAQNLTIADADRAGTVTGYRAYLSRFPSGPHVTHARARIDALEEEPVFRAHERETRGPVHRYYALQRYVDRYPNGRYAADAKREMDRILKQ